MNQFAHTCNGATNLSLSDKWCCCTQQDGMIVLSHSIYRQVSLAIHRELIYTPERREREACMPRDKCLTEDSKPGLPILSLRTRSIRLSAWVNRQARDKTEKKTLSMGWDQESVKVSTPLPLPVMSIILSSLKISRHATPQRTPEDWR